MILRIWLQCIGILILTAIPLMVIQNFQQKELLALTFSLAKNETTEPLLQKQMAFLRDVAIKNPEQSETLKKQFDEIVGLRKELIEFQAVQPQLQEILAQQSRNNLGWILVLSFILSLVISWNIVRHFQALLKEHERFLKRQNDLQKLESWQGTARTLVHEMRAPLTPIKLITSTWLASGPEELKELAQEGDSFREGLGLIVQKVGQLESMVQRFTSFAKLPAPQFVEERMSVVVQQFIQFYQEGFGSLVRFSFEGMPNKDSEPVMKLDVELLHNSFFATSKNASEANVGIPLTISFSLSQNENYLNLDIGNNGRVIPKELENQIFEFGISSKKEQAHNFGIGLAVAKKIALDHHGDLFLLKNDATEGVVFRFMFQIRRGWNG